MSQLVVLKCDDDLELGHRRAFRDKHLTRPRELSNESNIGTDGDRMQSLHIK